LLADGRLLKRLDGFYTNAIFTRDGRHALVRQVKGSVDVWDLATGKVLGTVEIHAGSIACFPDGRRMLYGGSENSLRLLDLRTGEDVCCVWNDTYGDVQSIAISPNGELAASGSYQTIKLWSVPR
jgi:WD40 repeat protein